MDWHVVPRSFIDGSIGALRAPVDLVVQLTGGRDPVSPARIAVDQTDAAAREMLGGVTGAAQKKEAADHQVDEGRRRAEGRREEAERSAEARVEAAEEAKAQRLDNVADMADRRREAEETAAGAPEKAPTDGERKARLVQLDEKADALSEKEKALTAREEAERLEESTAAVKAARKAN